MKKKSVIAVLVACAILSVSVFADEHKIPTENIADDTYENYKTTGDGGAIYNTLIDLTVKHSTFRNNNAVSEAAINSVNSGNGGAINSEANITITENSKFEDNGAASNGGALYASKDVSILDNTQFINNSANIGGAVYLNGTGNVVNIESAKFSYNSALYNGGGIYNNHRILNISQSEFNTNEAQNYGGAIYNNGSRTNGTLLSQILNTEFNENKLTAEGAEFGYGGAIYNSRTDLNISSDTFNKNETAGYGGAIANNNAKLSIDGTSSFTENKATGTSTGTGYGGAIYNTNSGSVEVTGTTNFSKNEAQVGGAIYNDNSGSINISGTTTFSENTATSKGGAIANFADMVITGNPTSGATTTFTSNSAGSGGAIYLDSNSQTTIDGATFNGNTATANGGAIATAPARDLSTRPYTYNDNSGATLDITGSTFENNTATNNGGAIYNTFYKSESGTNPNAVNISGNKFISNKASLGRYGSGGAIYIDGNNDKNGNAVSVNLSDNLFQENSVKNGNGGAICILGQKNSAGELTSVTVNNSQFKNNTALKEVNNSGKSDGGAIYNNNYSNLKVSSSTFDGNQASRYGGAIYNSIYANATIKDTAFTNNKSTMNDGGGAIYNAGNLNISDSEFNGNTGYLGGAIYNKTNTTVIEGNTRFINNRAEHPSDPDRLSRGGAIYNVMSGTLEIKSDESGIAEFSGNTADRGGAIYNDSPKEMKISANFSENKATQYGGAIFNNRGKATITGGKFDKNTAGENGGAIINNSTSADGTSAPEMSITGSQFTENRAKNAGAILNVGNGAKLDISGATFSKNSATEQGGAIVSNVNAITTIQGNSQFTENSAKEGGAIVNGSGKMTIGSSTFSKNTATVQAGAIYNANNGGTLELHNANFDNNSAKEQGGAISNMANMEIHTGAFYTNKVIGSNSPSNDEGGGALFLGSSSKTKIDAAHGQTTFYGNTSATNGGAIATRNSGENNSAAKLDISGTMFELNEATNNGGAIFNTFYKSEANENAVNISNNFFEKNKAGKDGGAIYNAASAVIGATFEQNTAGGNGGAIYNAASSVINGGDFGGNHAGGLGGAIYSVADLAINAENGEIRFTGNTQGSSANDIYMLGTDTQKSVLSLNSTDSTKSISLKGGVDGQNYDINVNTFAIASADSAVALGNVTGANQITVGNGNVTAGVINASKLNLNAGQMTTTGASKINTFNIDSGTEYIANNVLTVMRGTNEGSIKGSGLFTIAGNGDDAYINEGSIANAIKIQTGGLQTPASTITGGVINNGTLNLTDGDGYQGTLASNITGNGNLQINTVGNDKGITVDSGASVIQDKITVNHHSLLNIEGNVDTTSGLTVGEQAIVYVNNNGILTGNVTMTDSGSSLNINTTRDRYTLSGVTSNDLGILSLNGKAGTAQTSNSGTVFNILNGDTINNTNVRLDKGELNIGNGSAFTNGSSILTENASTISAVDGRASNIGTNINFVDGAQVKVDVDALSKLSDTFSNARTNGTTYLTDINLANLDKIVHRNTDINLNGTTGLDLTPTSELQGRTFRAMTPIRIMEATISEEGMLNIHPSGGHNDYKSFNPSALASPIAAQIGGYLTQLNSYDEAFRNMDMYMLMTKKQRQALKFRNKIASLEGGNIAFDPTMRAEEQTGAWFRPYATFEKVGLHNGPRVENVAYGSFFGGDSGLIDLGNGWDGVWGAYVGYNGSHQNYDGIGIYQNGGTLGLVGMAYKGNFFIGTTINTGASAGEASTFFGTDNFTMLMAGIAAKSGYNWELADGKFIIQPSLQMSYSFVNTFDYTNSAGVRIDSDPLNAIAIEPGIKFIGNLKNGWQPYAGVSVIINAMDKANFNANDISLPSMSVNPYVKYGVGVRKAWGERLTGFFQTFVTNGGRNGVGLSLGFRWAIGKDPEKAAINQTQVTKTVAQDKTKNTPKVSFTLANSGVTVPAEKHATGAASNVSNYSKSVNPQDRKPVMQLNCLNNSRW